MGRTAELFHFFDSAIYQPQRKAGDSESEGGEPD
jgi:hypothetical protein